MHHLRTIEAEAERQAAALKAAEQQALLDADRSRRHAWALAQNPTLAKELETSETLLREFQATEGSLDRQTAAARGRMLVGRRLAARKEFGRSCTKPRPEARLRPRSSIA